MAVSKLFIPYTRRELKSARESVGVLVAKMKEYGQSIEQNPKYKEYMETIDNNPSILVPKSKSSLVSLFQQQHQSFLEMCVYPLVKLHNPNVSPHFMGCEMFVEGLIRSKINHWPSIFVRMILENIEVEPTTLRQHREGGIRMLYSSFITRYYIVIQIAFVTSWRMGHGWGAVVRESSGEVKDILYGKLFGRSFSEFGDTLHRPLHLDEDANLMRGGLEDEYVLPWLCNVAKELQCGANLFSHPLSGDPSLLYGLEALENVIEYIEARKIAEVKLQFPYKDWKLVEILDGVSSFPDDHFTDFVRVFERLRRFEHVVELIREEQNYYAWELALLGMKDDPAPFKHEMLLKFKALSGYDMQPPPLICLLPPYN